jgi:hypothetical protein
MRLTLIIYIGTSLLLAWTLYKQPQKLTLVLAAVFAAAVFAAQQLPGQGERETLRSILMGADGLAVVSTWVLWRRYDSTRAAIVTVLGMVKLAFGVTAASVGMTWLVWASGNNALFISQVLVAGGFANGFMAWLGRSPDSADARSRGVLGYLERLP